MRIREEQTLTAWELHQGSVHHAWPQTSCCLSLWAAPQDRRIGPFFWGHVQAMFSTWWTRQQTWKHLDISRPCRPGLSFILQHWVVTSPDGWQLPKYAIPGVQDFNHLSCQLLREIMVAPTRTNPIYVGHSKNMLNYVESKYSTYGKDW